MAVYACADLHGRYDLYEKIKAFIKPEDTVYFLGDANDRGPDGWKLIKAIYNDPQFEYIKGNHEDMLVRAAFEYYDLGSDISYGSHYRNLCSNGGGCTFEDMIHDPESEEWIDRIRKLPTIKQYFCEATGLRFTMTHAGFSPRGDMNDILWDRSHFYDPWPRDGFDNDIIVHGHTPIPLMDEIVLDAWGYDETPGAFWYCDNHKVNIDVGAVWNDFVVLLNLDSLDEEIIY